MDRPFPRFTLALWVAGMASLAALGLVTVTLATQDMSDYHGPRRIAVLLAVASTFTALVEWWCLKTRTALIAGILFGAVAIFVINEAIRLGWR